MTAKTIMIIVFVANNAGFIVGILTGFFIWRKRGESIGENVSSSSCDECPLPSDADIEKKVEDTVANWKEVSKVTPQLVPTNKEIIIELIKWMRDFRK